MCGHVGIAGNLAYADEKTMKSLLLFDFLRGPDSTGLAVVKDDGQFSTVKMASNPINLFDNKKFEKVLAGWGAKAFIGHNRAATKGAVNDFNAHPYESGEVVGCHNGTLTAESWKALETAIGESTGTDSHAVIIAIDRIGIEETVKLMEGAWALVWYDNRDGTLNFLRNKERPFAYGYTADFKKLFWSSEAWMMRAAVTNAPANTYKMFIDDNGHSYYNTVIDWHYKFDLKELAAGGENKPKPTCKELKGKEPAPVVSAANFPVRHHSTGGTSSTTRTSTSSNGSIQRVHRSSVAGNPFANLVEDAVVDTMTKFGCSFCYNDVKATDDGIILWPEHGQCLCPECSGLKVSQVYLPANQILDIAKTASGSASNDDLRAYAQQ